MFKMMPVIEMIAGQETAIVINTDWIVRAYPRWEDRITGGPGPVHERTETVELATVALRGYGGAAESTYCFAGDIDAFLAWVNAEETGTAIPQGPGNHTEED